MSIKIIPEDDIYLTQAELERYRGIYDARYRVWSSTLPPPSFEVWLRQQNNNSPRARR